MASNDTPRGGEEGDERKGRSTEAVRARINQRRLERARRNPEISAELDRTGTTDLTQRPVWMSEDEWREVTGG
jgi:hypothetical protein